MIQFTTGFPGKNCDVEVGDWMYFIGNTLQFQILSYYFEA
jgi:hypothetical protein